MKKKKNIFQSNSSTGFDNLINVHTSALEENSKMIAKMLKELSKKKLSSSNIKDIKFIKKELKRLDKELDNLGGE